MVVRPRLVGPAGRNRWHRADAHARLTRRDDRLRSAMTPKMHADEVTIDAALVRRLVASQHARWAELPLEAVPSTGTVNAIYRLGDDKCVRLPRVERWAAHLDNELAWLPVLAPQLPLAVPEPLAAGSPGDGYP